MIRAGVVDPALTRELRRIVLRPGLDPDAPLPGDDLPDTVHIAVLDEDGTALSTCFVSPQPCPWLDTTPAWRLRQMATADGHRGAGLGALVLAGAERAVHAAGGALLWCEARDGAVGFYARHGFVADGAMFLDAELGIPHLHMAKRLREPIGATTSSTG